MPEMKKSLTKGSKKKVSRKVSWVIKVEIDDIWINDGFILDPEVIEDAIDRHCLAGCAEAGEVRVKTLKSPTKADIKAALGRYERFLEQQAKRR